MYIYMKKITVDFVLKDKKYKKMIDSIIYDLKLPIDIKDLIKEKCMEKDIIKKAIEKTTKARNTLKDFEGGRRNTTKRKKKNKKKNRRRKTKKKYGGTILGALGVGLFSFAVLMAYEAVIWGGGAVLGCARRVVEGVANDFGERYVTDEANEEHRRREQQILQLRERGGENEDDGPTRESAAHYRDSTNMN